MSDGPAQVRKVLLEAAVQAVTEHVLQTAERVGIDTESLGLELQFGLEMEGDGKVVPVVFLGALPPGQVAHTLRFSLGEPKEMARPDTSSELAMIMDHPPPRDASAAQTQAGEPLKPAVEAKIAESARPREPRAVAVTFTDAPKPIVESKASTHAPRERQEIQVTLGDNAKPVVESKVAQQAQPRVKAPEPSHAAAPSAPAAQSGGPAAPGALESKSSRPSRPAEPRSEVEARFAMLNRIAAARDDEDEVDEPTVSDGFPVRRDEDLKSSKGPKIVLPSHPVLKLRKASDMGPGRAGGTVEGDAPTAQRPEVAYQPPKPKEEPPPAEVEEEALPPGFESRFIVFDHQKLRRRYEVGADSGAGDTGDGPGDQSSSGPAGAED
jgi:hypothetical protein